jgi:anthranilate 1,2-dioxygenase ferredoxin component
MAQWHPVASVKDLEARKKKAVDVDGTELALFFIRGRVYALNDTCIHEGRQLSKGAVLFGKVVCPGHQWKFDPETGDADGQDGCQPTYPTRVTHDGTVEVFLTSPVAAR